METIRGLRRIGSLLGVGIVVAGLLTGCGADDESTTSADGSGGGLGGFLDGITEKFGGGSGISGEDKEKAIEAYTNAVQDPEAVFTGGGASESGEAFTAVLGGPKGYTLVPMTEGEAPALLLKVPQENEYQEGVDAVRVVQYDSGTGELIVPDEPLGVGAGTAGGYRGAIGKSANGDGVIVEESSAGSGDGSISRVLLRGGELVRLPIVTYRQLGEGDPAVDLARSESVPIEWKDTRDTSALQDEEAWRNPDESQVDLEKAATDAGLPVVSGTLRVVDRQGLLGLQGIQDPNPSEARYDTGDYVVVVFDSPTEITGHKSGDQSELTDSADLFRIQVDDMGSVDWSGYDGSEVTVAYDPGATWWPSDTGLPLGQPSGTAMVLSGAPVEAAPDSGGGGASEGKTKYASYHTGSHSTSEAFAKNVFDEFIREYEKTGKVPARITAHSPVTGEDYIMTCDGDDLVYCEGGNDAVVIISGYSPISSKPV